MQDLTSGSILRHIVAMAMPAFAGMIFQTLYVLVDLYFVAALGEKAIAGVGAAGNVQFVILALTQVLAVGTVAAIAQAVGRKDRADANSMFNQAIGISAACVVVVLVGGYLLAPLYIGSLGADAETVAAGIAYLRWFLPGLALQFAMAAMSSALRGTGVVRPTMAVYALSLVVNIVLAPILIAGWGTGRPLGVAGAGLASSIAIGTGVLILWRYFARSERYVRIELAQVPPRWPAWRRIIQIGLPAGGETILTFVYTAVVYWIIRDFGSAAQAGFSVGSRIIQSVFLPAMAIAFAVGPIAGQNFGARKASRVRQTFGLAALLGSAVMVLLTVIIQWRAAALVKAFTGDAEVIAFSTVFLRLVSWNFVAQGLIYTCSSLFQGMGDTRPALLSSCVRLATFVVPALWLSAQRGFRIEEVWYLAIATVALQAATSVLLLRSTFKRKLAQIGRPATPAAATFEAGSAS